MKTMAIRKPGEVMKAALIALVIRDVRKRFITSAKTNRSTAFVWLFIEPIIHVMIWAGVRSSYGVETPGGLSPFLFVLLGALPFLFFRKVMSMGVKSILANKGLYNFRQIKPIDCIISSVFVEYIISIFVFIIFFITFRAIHLEWELVDPLRFFFTYLVFGIFSFAISLIFSVIGFFFERIKDFMIVIQRVLYMVSGVFYPVESIPPEYREYFMLNPLFQVVEISRECFSRIPSRLNMADLPYLCVFTMCTLFISCFFYIAFRNKIMIEIEER